MLKRCVTRTTRARELWGILKPPKYSYEIFFNHTK